MGVALRRFAEIGEDLGALVAREPHELMRATECRSILDCAEMAAHASLFRTESRWGLYHYRVDYPEPDDKNWFCHSQLYKDASGNAAFKKRAIDPYIVPIPHAQRDAYHPIRVHLASTA